MREEVHQVGKKHEERVKFHLKREGQRRKIVTVGVKGMKGMGW